MKLINMGISNFRGFAHETLDFGQYTVLRGPNRAGKSTLQLAIAWCLTGACSLTTIDGKKWAASLPRTGAIDAMTVALGVDDVGVIERSRVSNAHELFGVCDTTKPAHAQPILESKLGTNRETLITLLDPNPFVLRTATDQRQILARILRPPVIATPPEVKALGYDSLSGAQQIAELIEKLKTTKLRELNTAGKNAKQKQPEKPVWPLRGRTRGEFDVNYGTLRGTRDEQAAVSGRLEGRIAAIQARLAEPVPTFTVLGDQVRSDLTEEVAHLTNAIKDAQSDLAAAKGAQLKAESQINNFNQTKQFQMQQIAQAEKVLARKPVECPEKACPIIQKFMADNAEQVAEAEKLKTVANNAYKEADSAYTKARAVIEEYGSKMAQLSVGITARTTSLRLVQGELEADDRERARKQAWEAEAKSPIELEAELELAKEQLLTANQALGQTKALLTKAELLLATLNSYASDLDAWEQSNRTIEGNLRESEKVREAIGALEKLQEKIIGTSLTGFMATLNRFLADLPMPKIEYDWELGFLADGHPIMDFLSDGQLQMMFEPALRVAAAIDSGINVVCLDHRAPIIEEYTAVLGRALTASGCQIIQTMTTSATAPPKQTLAGMRVYNIIPDAGDGARIEEAK